MRVVVGALLLIFGLQWLRKAILRASGHTALRDEEAIYRRELAASGLAQGGTRTSMDWYAFTFWYDFIVGDDWIVAAGVVLVLAISLRRATAR